jgi:hypothetical protein
VTVTYDGDAQRALLESFDDGITATAWWDAVRADYCDVGTPKKCVGRGSSGGYAHLTGLPPAALDDAPTGGSVRALLQDYFTNGLLPAPDAETIYVIHFPASTTIVVDGFAQSCQFFSGYHASFQASLPGGHTATVPYVVAPTCSAGDADLTSTVSHELIETATDPVDPDPAIGGDGYSMSTDTAWPLLTGSEVADLCIWADDSATSLEGAYTVVRSWSNVAAAAGHDPCVPAPAPASAPYFNVAPVTDALTLAVGASTMLELDAFADGSRPAWTVSVTDVSQKSGGTAGAATFALDRTDANASSKLHLSITMVHPAPSPHPTLLLIESSDTTSTHRWPLAITTP